MSEVFLTLVLAYLLKRLGLFSEEHSKVLVNYALYFPLPMLSFKTTYSLGLSSEVATVALGAWLVIAFSLLFAYFAGRLLKTDKVNVKTLMVISAFGNTAFLGYPYSFHYFGEEGLKYAVIYDSIGSFLAVSSIGFFLLSGSLELRALLFFPPFSGLLLGFILKGYPLPEFFWKFVDFSIASLLPVVLFSLGLSLKFGSIAREKELLATAMVIKMLISPAFALLFLKLLPINTLAYKVSVIESAMPTMITASVLVLRFGLNHHLALASAGIGIVISFFTTPMWVYVLKYTS